MVMVNPEIVEKAGKWKFEEGCLSVPERFWPISRPEFARATGFDAGGNPVVYEGDELVPTAVPWLVGRSVAEVFGGRVACDHPIVLTTMRVGRLCLSTASVDEAFAKNFNRASKEVRFGLHDELSPAQLVPTDDEGTLAVVMPMRI